MVFDSKSLSGFVFGGVGCGTSASKPCGVVGVMTIKIIISTRRTSISGTMFGSDIEPLLPPTAIPMENSFAKRFLTQRIGAAPAVRLLISGRRWGRSSCALPADFFCEQTEVIDAGRTYFVNGLDHIAVFRSRIGAHENGFVEAVSDQIL